MSTEMWTDCEFYKNRYSKHHALLAGVNKFYPKFSHLLPNLGDIWYKSSAHTAVQHLW
jgi:hypothetical protein